MSSNMTETKDDILTSCCFASVTSHMSPPNLPSSPLSPVLRRSGAPAASAGRICSSPTSYMLGVRHQRNRGRCHGTQYTPARPTPRGSTRSRSLHTGAAPHDVEISSGEWARAAAVDTLEQAAHGTQWEEASLCKVADARRLQRRLRWDARGDERGRMGSINTQDKPMSHLLQYKFEHTILARVEVHINLSVVLYIWGTFGEVLDLIANQ